MAIIYTYANFSPLNGSEKVLISDSETNQATRTATAQQIANLAGGDTGVNRVFFNDSVGLTPNFTQTIGNETVGRGVVEFSGTLLPGAGGTGKDSAALTGATAGQVLALNVAKDGWDFTNAVGEIYDLSTNFPSAGSVPLNLTDSSAVTTAVTLSAGTGISIASSSISDIVITNDAPAITYTAGNGIVSASLSSGIIAVGLKTGGGLAFNLGEIETDLSSTNIGGTIGSNQQVLIANGGGGQYWGDVTGLFQKSWAWTPCLVYDPTDVTNTELQANAFITYNNSNVGPGNAILGQRGTITIIGNLIYYDFYFEFTIDDGNYPFPSYLCIAADTSATLGGPGLGNPGGLPVVYGEQKAVSANLPSNTWNNGSVTITMSTTNGSSASATSMWPFVPQGGKVGNTTTGIVDLFSLVYNGAVPAVGNGIQTSYTNEWWEMANETESVKLAGTIIAQVEQAEADS